MTWKRMAFNIGEQLGEWSRRSLPFVSVVVPFYNAKKFVNRSVGSLLRQSYPKKRYEIILVDDGSTDKTLDAIWEKANRAIVNDNNVAIVRLPKRSGPAKARNHGIKLAHGDIIAFTDVDCVADREWIKELVKMFVGAHVGGVQGNVVTDFDELIYPLKTAPVFPFVTCNMAYRRDVLRACGLFDERFKYPFREDSELAYRVVEKGYQINYSKNASVYHPVKKLRLGDLLRTIKYRTYDALLYKEHPRLARRDLGRFVWKGLTFDGVAFLAGLIILTLPATFLSLLSYSFWIATMIMVSVTVLTLRRPSCDGKPISERIISSVCLVLHAASVEIGRIIGSIKFRKLLI